MTDHVEAALGLLAYSEDVSPYTPEGAMFYVAQAQVHATLALAEQKRIANLLTFGTMNPGNEAYFEENGIVDQIKAGLGL